MILNRTIAPTQYPVTLSECKADSKVEHDADDDLIMSLIAGATDMMDVPNGMIGRALMTQTWTLSVPRSDGFLKLYLPVTPVQSIASLTYYDNNNQSQSMTLADFHFYKTDDWAYLEPVSGQSWPPTFARRDAITVTFVCGYGSQPEAVPPGIRQAIRLTVSHWDKNRLPVTDKAVNELPYGIQTLVSMNRKGWVA